MNVLVLNAGSSSQKISLFKLTNGLPQDPLSPDWERKLTVKWDSEDKNNWFHLLKEALTELWSGQNKIIASPKDIHIVGHRVVHGGNKYFASTIIDEVVKADIHSFSELAPLHNEINLAGMQAIEKLLPPPVKQVAVFDTAFHRSIPTEAKLYPVPYEWFTKYNIQKFGFHGINHQYCAQRAAKLIGKDLSEIGIIVCHLGAGCSLAAIQSGKSADTTMGFTPLDGLMMASRSGSVDPGILLHLARTTNMSFSELDDSLNKRSGLKGISRLCGDMAVIIDELKKGNAPAKLAFDMYVFRVRRLICQMRASLARFDALVFTAGVGENAPLVRQSVCEHLDFLKVHLDPALNNATVYDGSIASEDSQVSVLVLNAREDWAIACECFRLVELG